MVAAREAVALEMAEVERAMAVVLRVVVARAKVAEAGMVMEAGVLSEGWEVGMVVTECSHEQYCEC